MRLNFINVIIKFYLLVNYTVIICYSYLHFNQVILMCGLNLMIISFRYLIYKFRIRSQVVGSLGYWSHMLCVLTLVLFELIVHCMIPFLYTIVRFYSISRFIFFLLRLSCMLIEDIDAVICFYL